MLKGMSFLNTAKSVSSPASSEAPASPAFVQSDLPPQPVPAATDSDTRLSRLSSLFTKSTKSGTIGDGKDEGSADDSYGGGGGKSKQSSVGSVGVFKR